MSAKQRRYFGKRRGGSRVSYGRSYRRSRGGSKLFNIKSMIAGGVGLIAVKMVRERFINLGNYNTAVDSIATGAVLKMLKLDNTDLITAGIKQLVAQGGKDLLSGGLFGVTSASVGAGV